MHIAAALWDKVVKADGDELSKYYKSLGDDALSPAEASLEKMKTMQGMLAVCEYLRLWSTVNLEIFTID